jgi:nucleoside 2-deoxyribosyltransferase
MIVYLCGPINGRSDSDCKDWRNEATRLWVGSVLDPMRRDYRGRELDPGIAAEIVAGDLEDLDACDAVLVYYDKPSVGTSMEVFHAKHNLKKPVIVIDHSGAKPSPWLVYHADAVVTSLADALATARRLLSC